MASNFDSPCIWLKLMIPIIRTFAGSDDAAELFSEPTENAFVTALNSNIPFWSSKHYVRDEVCDFIELFTKYEGPKEIYCIQRKLMGSHLVIVQVSSDKDNYANEKFIDDCYSGHLNVVFATADVDLLEKYLSVGWYEPEPVEIAQGGFNDSLCFKIDNSIQKAWKSLIVSNSELGLSQFMTFSHDAEYFIQIDVKPDG